MYPRLLDPLPGYALAGHIKGKNNTSVTPTCCTTWTGRIPKELGALGNLEELWLNNNQLTGEEFANDSPLSLFRSRELPATVEFRLQGSRKRASCKTQDVSRAF